MIKLKAGDLVEYLDQVYEIVDHEEEFENDYSFYGIFKRDLDILPFFGKSVNLKVSLNLWTLEDSHLEIETCLYCGRDIEIDTKGKEIECICLK